jgi:lia operon protein LiaF
VGGNVAGERRWVQREERIMRNYGLMVIGVVLILFGLMFLIGNVFDIDVGALCWPVGLILFGVWILLRPQLASPGKALRMRAFGPIRRDGAWQVADEELWLFVGDVHLDLMQAEIPLGETLIRVSGFVGNVRMLVPEGVGVSTSSTAFVTDVRALGERRDGFLAPVSLTSDDYETAERKVRLETAFFVADVRVRRG